MTGPFDTPDLPHVVALHRRGKGPDRVPYDVVLMSYDARILRRRRLVTAHDEGFFVDLAQVTGLDHGDRFELADGRLIEVIAAEEPLVQVTGDLARIAWHIGNRHTPCQIEAGRMLIRQDHVLEAMLAQLGAEVAHVHEPFTPEGGAYGHGRTMGHDHGGHEHAGHDHGAHDHGHHDNGHHDDGPSDHPHPHAKDASQAHAPAPSPRNVVARSGGPISQDVDHDLPPHGPFDPTA